MDRFRSRLCFVAIATGALALSGVATLGCASSMANVEAAKNSRYDADRAMVMQGVVDAVKAEFPRFDQNREQGWVKTVSIPVKMMKDEAPRNRGYTAMHSDNTAGTSGQRQRNYEKNQQALGQDTGKTYFIRFEIYVEGERPWRVRVQGYAAEQEAGMQPRPLTGDETPYWVEKREDSMAVAIYQNLRHLSVAAPGAPGAQ